MVPNNVFNHITRSFHAASGQSLQAGHYVGPAPTGFVGIIVQSLSCRSRGRSEEHTSELQSLMRISYAVFCLKKKNIRQTTTTCFTYRNNITTAARYTTLQMSLY